MRSHSLIIRALGLGLGLVLALATAGCASEPRSTTTPSVGTSGESSDTSLATTTTSATTTSSSTTTTTLSSAERLLAEMSTRQKAAQVLLLGFAGTTVSAELAGFLQESPPGGLLLLGTNITGQEQLRSLTSALQETAEAAGPGLFIAVDQEGGTVQRVRDGVPRVPSARTLGEAHTLADAAELARDTATGLLALGVNMNLAPVADVVADTGSFLYRRSYGDDPDHVGSFVAAVTAAYTEAGLVAAAKHFPGHGSAPGDTHGTQVITAADRVEFETVHLPPFAAAIAAGAEAVMMGHIVAQTFDGTRPASLSPAVVDALREEMGFSGLVIADDLRMAGAVLPPQVRVTPSAGVEDEQQTAVLALEAGCDLLISTAPLQQHRAMLDAIVEAVDTGRLPESRLDQAVLRVLETKSRHGLLAAGEPATMR